MYEFVVMFGMICGIVVLNVLNRVQAGDFAGAWVNIMLLAVLLIAGYKYSEIPRDD